MRVRARGCRVGYVRNGPSLWKFIRNADELPPADFVSRRREVPFSPDWRQVFEDNDNSTKVPETDLQALMQARPFEEPATSLEHTSAVRDRIVDALEALPDRQRWIFEARTFRGLSVRQVAAELNLSKSYVDRIHKAAQKQLQGQLSDLVRTTGTGD